MDGVRYKLFCLKQARNESLPPTSDCLLQHTKRANYQTLIWKHALEAQPNIPSPVENGWHHDKNGQLTPTLMTQSPAPEAVLELISCGCKKAKCQCNCSCSRQSMACTEACVCTGGEDCLNPHKVVIADPNESDITDDSDLDI